MNGRYVSRKISNQQCKGKRFSNEGLPIRCEETPVFELVHSNGQSIHVCEYHIEFYWNAWPSFRDAVRDIWPVSRPVGQGVMSPVYNSDYYSDYNSDCNSDAVT